MYAYMFYNLKITATTRKINVFCDFTVFTILPAIFLPFLQPKEH